MTHTKETGGTPAATPTDDPRLATHRVVLAVIVDAQGVGLRDATNNARHIVDDVLTDATDADDRLTTSIRGEFARTGEVITVTTLSQAMHSGLLAIRLTADPNDY